MAVIKQEIQKKNSNPSVSNAEEQMASLGNIADRGDAKANVEAEIIKDQPLHPDLQALKDEFFKHADDHDFDKIISRCYALLKAMPEWLLEEQNFLEMFMLLIELNAPALTIILMNYLSSSANSGVLVLEPNKRDKLSKIIFKNIKMQNEEFFAKFGSLLLVIAIKTLQFELAKYLIIEKSAMVEQSISSQETFGKSGEEGTILQALLEILDIHIQAGSLVEKFPEKDPLSEEQHFLLQGGRILAVKKEKSGDWQDLLKFEVITEFLDLLIARGVNIDNCTFKNERPLIFFLKALESSTTNVEGFKLVISLNYEDRKLLLSIIKYLLQKGANPLTAVARDDSYLFPLFPLEHVRFQDERFLQTMLDYGAGLLHPAVIENMGYRNKILYRMNIQTKIKEPFYFSKAVDIKSLKEVLNKPAETPEIQARIDTVCNSVLSVGSSPITISYLKSRLFRDNTYEKIVALGGLAPGVLDAFKQYKAKRSFQDVFLPIYSNLKEHRAVSNIVIDYYDDSSNPSTQIKQFINDEFEKNTPKKGLFAKLFKK